jgi:hypothetical protein
MACNPCLRAGPIESYGGDDETRTRDLCRDRTVLSTWPTHNQSVRCAVVGNRWLRWAWLAVLCATICATFFVSPPVLAQSLHDAFSRWVELVHDSGGAGCRVPES